MNFDIKEIPNWVGWVAQDTTGFWWGYSVEPLRFHNGWYENECGDSIRLGHSAAENWQSSLQVITRKKDTSK